MDLSLRDAARFLNVPEDVLYGWARSGVLPAYRVHNDYCFNRVEVQEWAAARGHRVSPELFAPRGSVADLPSLAAALERGGVHHGVAGATRNEVLAAVARLPGVPADVDRKLLEHLLVTRESLASTGVGDGIAIPHPRDPVVARVAGPVVLLCFLARSIDFGAIDGRPVSVLFTLLSPGVRVHLQLLSKIAFALHDELFGALLRQAAPAAAILERLRALDAQVASAGALQAAGEARR